MTALGGWFHFLKQNKTGRLGLNELSANSLFIFRGFCYLDFFTLQEEMPGSGIVIIANNHTSKLYFTKSSSFTVLFFSSPPKKSVLCNTHFFGTTFVQNLLLLCSLYFFCNYISACQ